MKLVRSTATSTAGVISIFLVYLTLIVVVLVFARQIIRDASLETPLTNVIVIPLAVLLPVFIFIAIGIFVLRLIRERRAGRMGARLKTRYVLVFTLVTFVSSIPQAVLAVSFIEIAMNRWFSSPAAEGLEAGVELMLEFNLSRLKTLETFGASSLYAEALGDIERAPTLVWDRVRMSLPLIDSMQIFWNGMDEQSRFGDPRGFVSATENLPRSEGLLRKVIYPDTVTGVGYSVFRYLKRVRVGSNEHVVIISSIIPKEFDRKADLLSAADDTFNQIATFQPMFRIVVIVFYSLFSLPLVFLSILVSFLLSDDLIRPIATLESATRRVAEGDFSYRILIRGGNELAELVQSFNTMVSELERSRYKLMQTEKVAAWQEIAQRLAHEIKNPLTPIKLSAQRILHRFRADPQSIERILEPAVEAIVREVDNLNGLLQEFRDFARLPAPKLEPHLLYSLIEEVLHVYSGAHELVTIDLSELDPELEIPIDRNQMKRVFSNLIKNALEAIDGEGTIHVADDLVRKGNSRYCRIHITDTGSGIDVDNHGRVFNPYFTTKEAGTGLGLAIVERIIFDHNGQIWFETQTGVGTTFFIDLPMEAE